MFVIHLLRFIWLLFVYSLFVPWLLLLLLWASHTNSDNYNSILKAINGKVRIHKIDTVQIVSLYSELYMIRRTLFLTFSDPLFCFSHWICLVDFVTRKLKLLAHIGRRLLFFDSKLNSLCIAGPNDATSCLITILYEICDFAANIRRLEFFEFDHTLELLCEVSCSLSVSDVTSSFVYSAK